MSMGMTALYRQRIEREERRIGQPLELAHEMLSASLGLLTKYFLAAPLFAYQRAVPADVAHMARIAALRAEDCGPCVRIGAAYARLDKADAGHIHAVMRGRFDDLPHDLSLGAYFGDAVARDLPEVSDLGEAVERTWGRAARVELSIAVATARLHPAMKRGLGIARSCEALDDVA